MISGNTFSSSPSASSRHRKSLAPIHCSALQPSSTRYTSQLHSMVQQAHSPAPAARPMQPGWWWLHPFRSMGLLPSAQQPQQWQVQQRQPSLLSRLFSSVSPSASVQRFSDAGGPGAKPTHLIVMVNGLFGTSTNWDVICEQLRLHLDPQQTLMHPSTANARFATYDGIDVCGGRLAEEIRSVVAQQQQLTRISILAHSMGGLMARYAIGSLYNPSTRKICGLEPAHFVTLATPHFGCDADGVAQVPFIGWTNELPLLGQQLFRFLQDISGPTAALIFRRTGQQFFMLDGRGQPQQQASGDGSSGSTADLPVLLQMTQDCPDRGLYFYSALSAFKTRTCYANTGSDHLVGFANSSIRSLAQLPPMPPAASTAKGVVLEDPLPAAFFPHTWQQLQQQWQEQDPRQQQQQQQHDTVPAPSTAAETAAAAALDSAAVQQAISQVYQPSRVWTAAAAVAAAAAAAGGGGGSITRQAASARASSSLSSSSGQSASWHELVRKSSSSKGRQELLATFGAWVPVQLGQQLQQQAGFSSVAALELEAAGAAAAATAAVADTLGALPPAGATPAAAAARAAQSLQVVEGSSPRSAQGLQVLEAVEGSSPRSTQSGLDSSLSDSSDDLMQLDTSSLPRLDMAGRQPGSGSSSSSRAARSSDGRSGVPAAAAAAAEQDLASGLSGAGIAAAASRQSAVDAVAADVAGLAAQQHGVAADRAQMVAHMLHRMQELPWRRIDVSFQGARFGFAHNNIQVTRRWLNFEGVAVPCHLAQQLQLMDALVADRQQQQQSTNMQQNHTNHECRPAREPVGAGSAVA